MKERRREPRLWLRTLMLVGVFMLSYANATVAQEEGGESEIVPVIGMLDGYDDKVILSTRSDGVIAPVAVTFSEADYPWGYNIYDIFVASELKYIRSFDYNNWHAWFMPFSMPVSNLPEGFVAARIVSVINCNLVVYEELGSEDVMTSNTPYLIKSTFEQTEPVTITTQNAKVLTINDQYLSEKGETGYEEIPADGMFLDGSFMYNEGQYYIRVADDNPYRWVVGSMPDYNEYAVEDIITLVSSSDPNAQTIIAYAMLVSAIDDLDGAITNYGESCNPTALTAAESKLKSLQEMQTKHTATAEAVNDAISNVPDLIGELKLLEGRTFSDASVTKAQLTAAKTTGTAANVKIVRTFWKDGYYNSLCLPFSLSATELAASPFAGYKALKKFVSATVSGSTLNITLEDATSIEAGVPYMISWDAAAENIVNPVFESVTVTEDEAGKIEHDNADCDGTFIPKTLEKDNQNLLFLGANNTLYWPNTTNPLKGFRCYFEVKPASGAKAGMNAQFADDIATGLNNVQFDNLQGTIKTVKFIENGKVVIMNNGVRYNAAGQQIR